MSDIELRDYLETEGPPASLPLADSNRVIVGQGPNDRVAEVGDVLDRVRVDVQVFDSDGTWNKPPGAKLVEVILMPGGEGGGGGGRVAIENIPPFTYYIFGGQPGFGPIARRVTLVADSVASSVAVTVGQGGVGGAGGSGSGYGTVEGDSPSARTHSLFGSISSEAVPNASGTAYQTEGASRGGSGGVSIWHSVTEWDVGVGAESRNVAGDVTPAPTAIGQDGIDGDTHGVLLRGLGGSGGSGGSAGTGAPATTSGGKGGDGGWPGGGGGGGGGVLLLETADPSISGGDGGDGADGMVMVITYF